MASREPTPLGKGLDLARRKVRLTQERLAERYRLQTGRATSNRTVAKWLRGDTEPRISEYNGLAIVMNEQGRRLGIGDVLPIMSLDGSEGDGGIVVQLAERVAPTGFEPVLPP